MSDNPRRTWHQIEELANLILTYGPTGAQTIKWECLKCGKRKKVKLRAETILHTCSCGMAVRISLDISLEVLDHHA